MHYAVLISGPFWLVLAEAAPLAAQGRIANATIETRTVTAGSLEREVQAVANRGGAAWIGYRTPMIPGRRQMCCYDSIAAGNDCCECAALKAAAASPHVLVGTIARRARRDLLRGNSQSEELLERLSIVRSPLNQHKGHQGKTRWLFL